MAFIHYCLYFKQKVLKLKNLPFLRPRQLDILVQDINKTKHTFNPGDRGGFTAISSSSLGLTESPCLRESTFIGSKELAHLARKETCSWRVIPIIWEMWLAPLDYMRRIYPQLFEPNLKDLDILRTLRFFQKR